MTRRCAEDIGHHTDQAQQGPRLQPTSFSSPRSVRPRSSAEPLSHLDALLTLLSDDDRPTFILDASDPPQIAYCNASLAALVSAYSDDSSFAAWVDTLPHHCADSTPDPTAIFVGDYAGTAWFSKRLGNEPWTVVYCSWSHRPGHVQPIHMQTSDPEDTDIATAKTEPERVDSAHHSVINYASDNISDWHFDWIRPTECHYADPWIHFLREYDWTHTQLGPMRQWPEDLRRLAYVLSAPSPRVILWGDRLLMLFNEAAKPFLGARYLECLGNPIADGLGLDAAQKDLECLRRNTRSGTSKKEMNLEYILMRHDFAEEAYFDVHFLPVPGVNGHLVGAVCEFNETTATVLAKRRDRVSAAILGRLRHAQDFNALWSQFIDGLQEEPNYIALASIYTKATDDEYASSKSIYRLQHSTGAVAAQNSQRIDINAESTNPDLAAVLKKARDSNAVVALRQHDNTLPGELAVNVAGYGLVQTAYVLPIRAGTSGSDPLAFIVVSMNPRLPFSSNDTLFVGYLHELVSKSCVVYSLPEEQHRDEHLEELNRNLTMQLRASTLEARKREETFARMARHAPFGMFMFEPDGTSKFVNDEWLRLTGFRSMEEFDTKTESGKYWTDSLPPEELTHVENCWRDALTSKTLTKFEHRLVFPPNEPGGAPQTRWLEATIFPELDEDDNVVTMQGWLVDVSDRKLAENLMAQQLHDALETKRASERFIDMVSHEIRNPLSAILQLADGILSSTTTSLQDCELPAVQIESIIDSARTIELCAVHQKKIVDDVLVISKLDSNLLVLSPDKSDPIDLIRRALKMHESGLCHAQVQASMHIEQSYRDLSVGYVLLDESRVLQVIINLLSNALKFTQDCDPRKITISIAATREMPISVPGGITFAAERARRPRMDKKRASSLTGEAFGEDIYLQFEVADTGRGLAKEEMDRLFQRFSQASPKTYKKYGGSGLGLYISKELCELQGGLIGVKSDGLGKGSIFAFFVKTRRCEPPAVKNALNETTIMLEQASITTRVSNAIAGKPRQAGQGGLHVLVVEDNSINQKVMAQQLRTLGCVVHVANHGGEALEFLSTTDLHNPPLPNSTPLSIVLMDVEMPVMDGLTCTKRIRQLEATKQFSRRVPIIVVTANARNEQITKALGAGVDEVVTKPFRIPELYPRMEALVRGISGGVKG